MNVYEEVRAFYESYPGEKRVIGTSVEGRAIFALFIGDHTGRQCISQYAIHAREWITAYLAIEHIRRGLNGGGAWVIPLANPDGALLSEEGLDTVSEARRAFLRPLAGRGFPLWKANANAVDLNVNFDARWGRGTHNVRTPASENYIGSAPFSEPETRALRDFTLLVRPDLTVSWHTKGEEIYWQFRQPPLRRLRDRKFALLIERSTGYPLRRAKGSAGGYKDWCIQKLGIPAFTVEVGSDRLLHPLKKETLPALLLRTGDVIKDLVK